MGHGLRQVDIGRHPFRVNQPRFRLPQFINGISIFLFQFAPEPGVFDERGNDGGDGLEQFKIAFAVSAGNVPVKVEQIGRASCRERV